MREKLDGFNNYVCILWRCIKPAHILEILYSRPTVPILFHLEFGTTCMYV